MVVRLFNTVGVRQTGHYGMVIPRLMSQAIRGEPLTVYGDGIQQRCFCDVTHVVGALIGLCGGEEPVGKMFNIGSTREVSILELAEMICHIAGSPSEMRLVPLDEAFGPGFEDMQRSVPDIARINALLSWESRIPLEQTLIAVRDSLRPTQDQRILSSSQQRGPSSHD